MLAWTAVQSFWCELESFRNGRVPIVLVALTLSFPGCETAAVRESTTPASEPTAMAANGGMLFVFVREFSFDHTVHDLKDDSWLIACAQDAVMKENPHQRIISFDEFSQTAFPGMATESVPRQPEYYATLLESQRFRERADRLGLRYVVFIGGLNKSVTDSHMYCGGGYGGAACFGMVLWDKETRLAASVLDLQEPAPATRLETTAKGTAWLAIVGIYPIGVPSSPGWEACNTLGTDVARFLRAKRSGP